MEQGTYWKDWEDKAELCVSQDFFHARWEQESNQLHENEPAVDEVHSLFKEHQIIHLDGCAGAPTSFLEILYDLEFDKWPNNEWESCFEKYNMSRVI